MRRSHSWIGGVMLATVALCVYKGRAAANRDRDAEG